MQKTCYRLFDLLLLTSILFSTGCTAGATSAAYPPPFPAGYLPSDSYQVTSPILTNTPYFSPIPNTSTPSSTITPTPYFISKWKVDPKGSNFALLVLDYETLNFKEAYFFVYDPCSVIRPYKSDDYLIAQGTKIFKKIYAEPTLQHIGDFALYEMYPGDIGGAVVLDPCTGEAIFGGSIGMGAGEHIYPIHPIEPKAFKTETGQIRQPIRIDVLTSPASTNVEGFEAAWNSAQSLNLVHDFASFQYSVFIYLYAPFVHEFYPPDAEWLIFLHRGPSQ